MNSVDREERHLVLLGVVGIVAVSLTAVLMAAGAGPETHGEVHETAAPALPNSSGAEIPPAANLSVSVNENLCGNWAIDPGEYCDDGNPEDLDGCSSSCKVETPETIYVAPYVGNIDGGFSEDWYYMFEMLADFHNNNSIPGGFSVYPSSMHGGEFAKSFQKIYFSPYIEFVQKGNVGDETSEAYMYNMTFHEVRDIMLAGRGNFTARAAEMLGVPGSEVSFPLAYNQPQGKFSETMRDALEDLGFKIFYEMYKNDELPAINSTEWFDVLQYGVSFTSDGSAGRDSVFSNSSDIIDEIKSFAREDVNVLRIEGRKIVPLWVHQMDFEDRSADNALDKGKWDTYTSTYLALKSDPGIILIGPSGIWNLRHPGS